MASCLHYEAHSSSAEFEEVNWQVLVIFTNKTAIMWYMCHIAKWQFPFRPTMLAAFEITERLMCEIAKTRNEKKDTPGQIQSRTLLDNRKCAFHLQQAMLGEVASFLTKA